MTVPKVATDVAFHGKPEKIVDRAREAERRGGISGLFVAEAAHDPFIALALAAASTERIELGTSVAVAFARTPMELAHSAYDLQRLSAGRLVLGLGSQIKPHITRRYGMPYSRPAARMREYVEALQAIWHSWQTGERLAFEGEFYQHTLMPPMFSPGPLEVPSPRVWVAAVGPLMVETAGTVADGIICHPLLSRSYLADVLAPQVQRARSAAGRDRDGFEFSTLVMVATGRTEEQLAAAIAGVRKQIGFYASTPAYAPVLEHHGWQDLHEEAHVLTKAGRWDDLASLVDDEVLHAFAVVGELDEVGPAFRERFAGIADRVTTSMPYAADEALALDVIAAGG
ncbi:TIGR03617 family F420-dependent LLM class oxidoreductase [Nocardioides marmoriginsengisoli]|uniref:TIGR03617 family F420-dependent LLM class oxidoreductase n=1 Tax=Nocardioides marmoriginsengisoli TaxID=661483 RepID=A0A3N0CGJ5_9ACTN|nr:TIGR03617 family F420-dependent LLM class oxidoreductase [Nocardioides marmoriginsengisoli]RNL62136.1 TIGR03617 family F420-dependent LLM class oxidoreductase [Nocardioides marmoriginsengisoli]